MITTDPSASQPTEAPIAELRPVSELPEDAIEAATEGAARFHYEAFRAIQVAVGAPNPVPYEQLSERTRRIQKDQARDAATAALAAALPFLERALRAKIADEIERTLWNFEEPFTRLPAMAAAARVARGGEATE